MKTILISSLISAIAVILIPTSFSQKVSVPVNDVVLHIQTNQHTQDTVVQEATQSLESTGKTIRLLVDDEVHCVEFEKYLSQVLMSEMPMSFELEALKAQAVAARTFAEKRMQNPKHSNADICSDSACCQAWTSLDGLKEKFGDAFDANYEKANTAVSETSGEVLLYNNELIDATYFSCSGGNTEAAVAVWGSEVPYLQAVKSPGEEDALRYHSICSVKKDVFQQTIQKYRPEVVLEDDPLDWIKDITYTTGGGVERIQIGNVTFSGVEIRTVFQLNSTKFTVDYANGFFHFDVLGYGHRVGMSQYGANNMAENGFGYRVILQYYYQGVRIKKLPC